MRGPEGFARDTKIMISRWNHPSQATVLVVDDDESVRDALCQTLVSAGYLVMTAPTGHPVVFATRKFAPSEEIVMSAYGLTSMFCQ